MCIRDRDEFVKPLPAELFELRRDIHFVEEAALGTGMAGRAILDHLHHQFAGGVVVFGAAVADTSQQVIDLVAETALRQSYVQHGLFGFLLLYRRERGCLLYTSPPHP